MTVGSSYSHFVSNLASDYDINEARSVAAIAFEHVLGLSRIDLTTRNDSVINSNDLDELNSFLSELLKGKPVQYITGQVWFQGLRLKVNENVLIPRIETEELVDWIKSEILKPPGTILDFCTGSGCIAIALKKAFPESIVIGVDISESALKVASENARNNKLDVEWLNADILNTKVGMSADLIVSNPPYVLQEESKVMSKRVKHFEPYQALFVPDTDPLIFYKSISEWSLKNANCEATIYYEINEMMGKEISDLHLRLGYTEYLIKKDLQDKERFFKALLPVRSL